MQIIELSDGMMIALCFILWPVFQVAAALLARALPDRLLSPDTWFFRLRAWEKDGRIYRRLFAVHRWKKHLPDGGAVVRNGFRKKKLQSISASYLDLFLVESCRAELTHFLAIWPFWVFGFFTPPGVIWLMLLYALVVNLPCIIVQRYNRPRMIKIRAMQAKRASKMA